VDSASARLATGLPLTLSEAAAILKVSRNRALAEAVRSGRVQTVPWGQRVRIPAREVQRLMDEGLTSAEIAKSRRQKAPVYRPRPPGKKVDVDAELRQMRSMTLRERLAAADALRGVT
jgi:hypothetical protein